MELNKKGNISTFYRWSYGLEVEELPKNFCPFFWKLVLAGLLFVFTWLSYPWGFRSYSSDPDFYLEFDSNWTYDNKSAMLLKRVFTGLGLYVVATVFAAIAAKTIYLNTFSSFLYGILMIILILLIAFISLVLVVGLAMGFVYVKNTIRNNEFIKEVVNISVEKKQSFMEQHCPKIDWVKEDE